jgi:hypothetical protein
MLAGALNKGFRGATPWLTGIFLVAGVFAVFTFRDIESNSFPNLFYQYFSGKLHSRAAVVLTNYLIMGIGVLIVSLIAGRQEIVEKANYFPVFIYLLICLAALHPSRLSAQSCANIFLLYAFYKLFDSYREDSAMNKIFEAGFLTGLSAFATITSMVNFPLFFIVLAILRPFNWREWLAAVIGFLSPVFIYECIAYLGDFHQWYFITAGKSFFADLGTPNFSEYYFPLLLLVLILLLVSIAAAFVGGFGNTVKKQKAKTILLWYLLFNSVGFFTGGANASRILLTFAFPLSFFIGDLLFGIKQLKITNTILTLLFLCIVFIFLAEFDLI